MCKCTPGIRTPWCGKGDCVPSRKEGTRPSTNWDMVEPLPSVKAEGTLTHFESLQKALDELHDSFASDVHYRERAEKLVSFKQTWEQFQSQVMPEILSDMINGGVRAETPYEFTNLPFN